MGTLYIVATPIGNLEDITLRALRILREVSLIAAEDTRTTRKLLAHYDISRPLISYNEHNRLQRTPQVLAALAEGHVALVSEAGMPGLSDPGVHLVRAAVEGGFPVVPVPGPSAVVAALAASGLPTRQFTYIGFLPRRQRERRKLLSSLAAEPRTIVVFESPHRLRQSLADLLVTLGDRNIAVGRELTKVHEEIYRGAISQALEHFQEPRGEFTLVIEGASEPEGEERLEAAVKELRRLRQQGARAKDAVTQVASRYTLPRRRLYQEWLRLDSGT